jgi:hypothetical protein
MSTESEIVRYRENMEAVFSRDTTETHLEQKNGL